MNLFLVVSKVRDLHHRYTQASEMAREVIREFYRRADDMGAIPLGYRVLGTTRQYCWVTFKAMPLQGDYIRANTPSDASLAIYKLDY